MRGRNNHRINVLPYHRFMIDTHTAIRSEDNHFELMRKGYHSWVFYTLLSRAGSPQCAREMLSELLQEEASFG